VKYNGKYFGLVRDTNDPEQRGRIRLFCPEVMGGIDNANQWLDWALPCFPWFVNQGIGLNFIPPKGDVWGVWVEFRQADIKYPIWTGVFPLGNLRVDQTKTTFQAEERLLLGKDADEAAVLGNTFVSFFNEFFDQITIETHPTAVGPSGPPLNIAAYSALKAKLNTLLSNYVFVKKTSP